MAKIDDTHLSFAADTEPRDRVNWVRLAGIPARGASSVIRKSFVL